MHDVVVLLDLDEVDGVAKTRRLEQVSRVGKMFYTPGWGAGRVEFPRIGNRRRGFADEVATAIQRVNANAELIRTRLSALRCARVTSQRR
jgi:hypothetical protein